jgi:hypothetical protein
VDPGALGRRQGIGAAVALLLLGALLAGCGPRDTAADPAFRAADCPARITTDVLTPVTCGWVQVPERHAQPGGPHIKLFVARVQPGTEVSGEPAVWLGYDVGGTVEYGSMATLAPRIHREVIIMDARGTGFSRPHLDCPEVAAAAPQVTALPSEDPAGRAVLRSAVRACHQRLTDDGVDVAAYGLDEVAADVRDVLAALDVRTASLWTAGTSSRLLGSVLDGADAGTYRLAVVDDGPLTTAPDDQLAGTALDEALAAADALCDASCDATGRPGEVLAALAAQLDAAPVTTTTGDGSPVVLDGARLRGVAAWELERSEAGAALAQDISAAAGGTSPVESLATAEQALCLGQRPKCDAPDFAYGVWWTVRCRNEAPAGGPFAEDVCAQWPVGRAVADASVPTTSVPVLTMYGALDPYVPASERELPGLHRRVVLVDPARGQDAMIGCIRAWRNHWVDDPSLEPVDVCPGGDPPVTGTRTWDG